MGNTNGQEIGYKKGMPKLAKGSRLMHKRPGPACCENARYGSATSQQRAGPDKALVRKSCFKAATQRSPEGLFFPLDVADHKMWCWECSSFDGQGKSDRQRQAQKGQPKADPRRSRIFRSRWALGRCWSR